MSRPVARPALALALLVTLLAASNVPSAQATRAAPLPAFYAVTALAGLDGIGGAPADLNAVGQAVGTVGTNALYRAARWDGGAPTDLGTLVPGWNSFANAINAQGEIVGESSNGEGSSAFLYRDGALHDLGSLGPTGRASAYDINDAGQIVGRAEAQFAHPLHAYLWEDGRGMRDLGTFPGYLHSAANAINDAGEVVGVATRESYGPGIGYYRAFRWTAETGLRALAGLDGGDMSWATDLNDAGQIVGWHDLGDTSHAFLWSEGEGVRDLPPLPGYDHSTAAAVNNADWAVGRSRRADEHATLPGGVARATLFAHGQAVDLNGLLPPDSGWELAMATDINDAGQIVGVGVRDGVEQGFLLTPTGAPGAFCDVAADAPYAVAVAHLAQREIVGGYQDRCFGPATVASRAEAAAFVARAMPAGPGIPTHGILTPPACTVAGTWDCEDWGNRFADRGGLPAGLWRAVGTLAHYGVASGYDGVRYGPDAPVSHAQAIALIARAMVAAGRWDWQPNGPAPPAGVPPAHDHDLRTFLHYAGDPPALSSGRDWDDGASRGWLAQALVQALDTP